MTFLLPRKGLTITAGTILSLLLLGCGTPESADYQEDVATDAAKLTATTVQSKKALGSTGAAEANASSMPHATAAVPADPSADGKQPNTTSDNSNAVPEENKLPPGSGTTNRRVRLGRCEVQYGRAWDWRYTGVTAHTSDGTPCVITKGPFYWVGDTGWQYTPYVVQYFVWSDGTGFPLTIYLSDGWLTSR